jgi:hypothetical protein
VGILDFTLTDLTEKIPYITLILLDLCSLFPLSTHFVKDARLFVKRFSHISTSLFTFPTFFPYETLSPLPFINFFLINLPLFRPWIFFPRFRTVSIFPSMKPGFLRFINPLPPHLSIYI